MNKIKVISFTVLLSFVFLIACSTSKNISQKDFFIPKKALFAHKNVVTGKGAENFMKMLQKSVDTITSKQSNTSLKFVDSLLSDMSDETVIDSLSITFQNDSIWRHKIYKGRQLGDYQVLTKNDSIIYKYGRDKVTKYGRHNLFKNEESYKIKEYPTDRKKIKGYDCFKLVIITDYNDSDSDFGNSIYEMYVTKEIDLPVHSVINIGKFISNRFPLEVVIKSEKFEGMTEKYVIVELE